jgi:hypothetical protein
MIPCSFNTSDFWYILNPKDQQIRNQIMSIGKRLDDKIWKLKPNFGIKSGINEAFIIDEKKYLEIINNCSNEKELELTKRLIQKILRGEDIKRYNPKWEQKYLITTFPAANHEINLYPAIKKHLEGFAAGELREKGYAWIADDETLLREYCKKRLDQNGKEIVVNGQHVLIGKKGKPIKARKKTSNDWFELQDNVAFWKDFAKPKLIWKRIGSDVRFAYDDEGYYSMDSTCIVTGKRLKYLCGLFNSKMGRYLMHFTPRTGTGDALVSKQAFKSFYVPFPSLQDEKNISDLVDKMIANPKDSQTQAKLDKLIYNLYEIYDNETISHIEASLMITKKRKTN